MKLSLPFILLFVFGSLISFGQFVHPIRVIPANPTPADQVELIFQVTTGGQGKRVEFVSQFSDTTILAAGCYFHGFLASPKTYFDTVRLGQLATGMYKVNFVATGTWSQQQCDTSGQAFGSTAFSVSNTTGTRAEISKGNLNIYPNPASGQFLKIASQKPVTAIAIFDITGNQIQRFNNVGRETDLRLNIQHLPKGVYLLLTETDSTFVWNRLIRN